ncbi:MAG: hypothetical protein GY716_19505 [bacterium]|nr:hypothetical protein [bacterium]
MNRSVLCRCLLAAAVLVAVCPARAAGEPRVAEADAVVVNLTRNDLNRMVGDSFAAAGVRRLQGNKARMSRGVRDVTYRAEISDPVLSLAADGRIALNVDVLDADVRVGEIERRIIGRKTRCMGTGLRVDPDEPLHVRLDLRLAVEGGALRVVAEDVELSEPRKRLKLTKPVECRNKVLPKWMMWWIGKPLLKRRLARLDEVLLERAAEDADELSGADGLLRERWNVVSPDDGSTHDLQLYPQGLHTDDGSLQLRFAVADGSDTPASGGGAPPIAASETTSYVAISEGFFDHVMRSAIHSISMQPRSIEGSAAKMFKSRTLQTLIPGLRDRESSAGYSYSLRFTERPAVRFEPGPENDTDAVIALDLSGLEVTMWDVAGEEPIGVLDIVEADVAFVPFLNVVGGVSFRLARNQWRIVSRGIEFDDELLGSTLQEIVFGEIFETQYDPLSPDLGVGDSVLQPSAFRVTRDYLVVELSEPEPASPSDEVLHANR